MERFLQVVARRLPTLCALLPNIMKGLEATQEAKSDGWIDILLSNSHATQAIVIENEIWAGDQYRQLPRYYWELTTQKEYDVQAVVYLSPLGHHPSAEDWPEDDLNAISPLMVTIS